MKNLRTEEVVTIQEVVAEIICNCCGKTIDAEHTIGSDINSFKIHFGYGSRFDMTSWEMDICDDCLEAWVKTFKHPVSEKPYELC